MRLWGATFIHNAEMGCIAARNASAWPALSIGAPKRCEENMGKQERERCYERQDLVPELK